MHARTERTTPTLLVDGTARILLRHTREHSHRPGHTIASRHEQEARATSGQRRGRHGGAPGWDTEGEEVGSPRPRARAGPEWAWAGVVFQAAAGHWCARRLSAVSRGGGDGGSHWQRTVRAVAAISCRCGAGVAAPGHERHGPCRELHGHCETLGQCCRAREMGSSRTVRGHLALQALRLH